MTINYSTFSSPKKRQSQSFSSNASSTEDDNNNNSDPPPNLYASPIVSSALITAFGLPTLVEYEAPKTTIAATTIASAAAAEEEEEQQESKSPSFTRITSRRIRSQSLPLGEHIDNSTTITTNSRQRHTAATTSAASNSQHNNRRLTKSANSYSPNHHHHSSNTNNNNLHLNTVTSYTYRVRAPTISTNNYSSSTNAISNNYYTQNNENGHHLLMVQNPDGTYSHANVHDGEPFVNDDTLFIDHHHHGGGGGGRTATTTTTTTTGNNDGGESGGLIQMTPHHIIIEENIVPLTTITQLGEMLTDVTTTTTSGGGGATTLNNNNNNNEEKGNNSSNNVPLPPELLHPQYTSTTPALKLWPLAILVFYNVSGGPFGIEPSIRAAGNFYSILGFIIFPFVWSLPEALVTAELGSTFQDPSAGVAWVTDAFGEKMGCLCGYLGWVSGATDNAIYPTLFLEYVTSVMGLDKDEFSGWTRFGLVATISISLSLLNYTGLEIVGKASLVVCVIAMSPFIIMTLIGAPQVVPSRWLQMPEVDDGSNNLLFDDDFQTSPGPLPLLGFAGILWRPFMNNMFWNLNSFDSAASFAGETTDVRKTYPRGIFIGLVMTIVFYIVPLMVAVGATDYSQSEWVDGHLGAVAVDIGGSWLGAWTIFAAGISNLALFEAELSADAFQLMGMAERGYLPKIFQKRSRYGTPTTGIIVGTVVIILFGCADFGQLLELLNANYAISLLLEYAAFVKLRLFHKELERPYRIPLPDWAAVLLAVPPSLATIAIILISNWYVYIFTFGAIMFGLLFFKFGEIAKRHGWFTYEIKARGYAMPPVMMLGDDSTGTISDPSSAFAVVNEGEWEYGEENKIT